MANGIEYITFDNDELQTTPFYVNGVMQPQQTVYLNGTIEVDYKPAAGTTTGTYTIDKNLTITGSNFETRGLGGGGILNEPDGNVADGSFNLSYGGTFSNPELDVSYSTKKPSQADSIAFNSDPGQPDNVEYFSNSGSTPLTSSAKAPVTCFVTGTAITTENGPVAVEHLAVGDMALTTSGAYSRVRWIGHRTIDCRRDRHPGGVMPVRIAAHAFGAGLPSRDLLVSPGHAVCVDVGGETLIPAQALVNGTTIVQLDVDTVTYWHVELEAHDVLLAENLPCESYLDMGNRGFFVESGIVDLGARVDAAHRTHADFCRPFHDAGAVVAAVRCRLAALAAASVETEAKRAAA